MFALVLNKTRERSLTVLIHLKQSKTKKQSGLISEFSIEGSFLKPLIGKKGQ